MRNNSKKREIRAGTGEGERRKEQARGGEDGEERGSGKCIMHSNDLFKSGAAKPPAIN